MATVMGAPRDLVKAIKSELEKYPIKYDFEHGGKHPYVQIETASGERRKVSFSISPRSEHVAIMSTLGVIRRLMKTLGVAPYPECRRETKTGTLGMFMEAAANKAGGRTEVDTLPPVSIATSHTTRPDDDDDGDDDDDDFDPVRPPLPLCPDAIRAQTAHAAPVSQPIRRLPVLTRPDPTPTMQEPEHRRRPRLTDAEIATATRLIITNADIDDANRTVTYHDGWSDQRVSEIVAAAAGRDSRADIIANLRRKSFGLTLEERAAALPAAAPNDAGLAGIVADLVRRVTALEDAATRP